MLQWLKRIAVQLLERFASAHGAAEPAAGFSKIDPNAFLDPF